jgi:hypothetical protein
MGYERRPFNPLTPTHNQVVNELNQANENFDILARAFLNNDPTTGVLKSDVYTFRRVDLTSATSDYELKVGEEAIIRFVNATSVSLRIALVDGAVYEFFSPSIPQGSLLHPNHFLYPSQFTSFRLYLYWTGSNFAVGYDGLRTSGFLFYADINKVLIFSSLGANRILGSYGDVFGRHIGISGCSWDDTTAHWTSLGTIVFSSNYSSYILIRRLL